MKSLVLPALVFSISISPTHAGDAGKPPDPLQAFGLTSGMEYKAAKAALLASGWSVQPSAQSEAAFPASPEVECGSGLDAICSAGFSKGSEAFGLVVERRGTSIVVTGAY